MILNIIIIYILIVLILTTDWNKRKHEHKEPLDVIKKTGYIIENTVIHQKKINNNDKTDNDLLNLSNSSFFNEIHIMRNEYEDVDKLLAFYVSKMKEYQNTYNLSSKHKIHEDIDDQIISEILDMCDKENLNVLQREQPTLVECADYNNSKELSRQEYNNSPNFSAKAIYCASHTKYSIISEAETDEKNEKLNFIECKILSDPNIDLSIQNLQSKYTHHNKDTTNLFNDEPKNLNSDLNEDSIITSLNLANPIPEVKPINTSILNQSKTLTFADSIQSSSYLNTCQLITPQLNIERIYFKFVNHITNILFPSFSKWYLGHLNDIKKMIDHTNFLKCSNNDSFKSHITLFDEKIKILLDFLNLRKNLILERYELDGYEHFNKVLTGFIRDLNLNEFIYHFRFKFEEDIMKMLYVEFLQLFKFFKIFPELITMRTLFRHEHKGKIVFYIRLVHLIILENETRPEEIRPIILFLMKKMFTSTIKKFDMLDMPFKKNFNITEALKKRMICNKDHSNLYFFMWSLSPKKTSLMRYVCKFKGVQFYDLTVNNIEHFRAVFLVFLFQHAMFIKYYNFDYGRYKDLLSTAIKDSDCVFCLFNRYLGLIDTHLSEKKT